MGSMDRMKDSAFKIMQDNDIEEMLTALEPGQAPYGLVRSYLEFIQECDINDVVYTAQDGDIETVLYIYCVEDETVIEEWKRGQNVEAAVSSIIETFAGQDIMLRLEDEDPGALFDGKVENQEREMKLEMTGHDFADQCSDFTPDIHAGAVEVLSQEWWTIEEAEEFLRAATATPKTFAKVAVRNGTVIGVGTAHHGTDKGWISSIYVHEDWRRQGVGRTVLQSLLADLSSNDLETAFLGVDESNTAAISLYRDEGFAFTDFVKYEFNVE